MRWFTKLFRKKGAYVGSFKLTISSEPVYVHCFETKRGKRQISMVNCDSYPNSSWEKNLKRTEIYQLRIRPWAYWGKKDEGIMTYKSIHDPKEEFLAKLKGESQWIINVKN